MTPAPYQTERQIAERLGVTTRTLRRWRKLPDPPPCYRVGCRYRYRIEEVEAWLRERAVAVSREVRQ